MPLSRRAFIGGISASTLAWTLRARAQPETGASPPFTHGVASGDPLSDRVILWTRMMPESGASAAEVRWLVATDPALGDVMASGTAGTDATRDFTVKVDVRDLEPGRIYYYAFEVDSKRSPVGRTKTMPDGPVDRIRLATVSCANYPAGYFTVYRRLAERTDLDAIVHLGDYIYEFENGVLGDGTQLDRLPAPPREVRTLDEYRQRYAQYRSDPDLQEAHRQHPFIVVWDDHELANNAWRGGSPEHDPFTEGPWSARRAAAYRAYLEWMPIRESAGPAPRLYRRIRFGSLADLLMLDARALRDEQAGGLDVDLLASPRRTLLGAEQETWLHQQLRASASAGTSWRLIGQQVMFSPLTPDGTPALTPDSWDGYRAERRRLLDLLATGEAGDVAIVSGDFHSSWAFDIPADPWTGYNAATGEGSLAVELLTPSVSSPPLLQDPFLRVQVALLRTQLPHLRYLEGDRCGYALIEVTAERLRAEYHLVPDVRVPGTAASRAAGLTCRRGAGHLEPDPEPLAAVDAAPPAP